ncbi:penicillin-binding protein 2 [Shimazuella sp. AN120528]|uniref:peptidoglycan D,D-transpeptidase FtsI family protein n=1 Tax=Shimazuella soli TaxID=1892854 RepID=UPI001F0F208A|nr:penicillin-binding transpeptidase domain-containing protein [Shimazuella soli]MCH5584037.1 penicillin-binding protein 2 [Shimazuella soli]
MQHSEKKNKVRSVMIGFTLMVLLSCVLIRLLWIQTFDSKELLAMAEKRWENSNSILHAKRGSIYDRTKQEAYTWEVPGYYFVADPSQIKDVSQTAKILSPLLEIPVGVLEEKLSLKKKAVEIKYEGKGKYSPSIYSKIFALKKKGKVAGIYGYPTHMREYNSSELAHVLGFLNSNGDAVGGVEQVYDKWLRGVDGTIKYHKAKNGMRISDGPETFKPPVNGKDLILSIDAKIQHETEDAINEAMKKYQAKGATAIVADPKTGEILSMVSRPTFDPQNIAKTFDPAKNGHNIAVESQYEPGSTFKIVTLAASINEKLFKPNATFASGSIKVGDRTFHDSNRSGWGTITYQRAVELSSNVGFIHLGQQLGAEKLSDYIRRFGFGSITEKFGKRTGIDLPAEGKGYYYNRALYPVELAASSFGQGISVTPIQQIAAISAIANNGYWVKPHVLKEVVDPRTKKEVYQYPITKHQIIEPQTATKVRQILRGVVLNGTAKAANSPDFEVAGKTGTAQIPDPKGGYIPNEYIVSFIGFAPSSHPDVVIYVAFDRPTMNFSSMSGGAIAAPVAREILEKILPIRQVTSK